VSTGQGRGTLTVRAGAKAGGAGEPVVEPVTRAVIHRFGSAGEFAEVMADAGRGYLYGRIRDPNTDELAAAVAALEGAEAAHCYASGMAAISAAVELAGGDGVVVASDRLYGQTAALIAARGSSRFVDVADRAAVAAALAGAAALYVETISNPQVAVADIEPLAAAAHAAGALLVVDNTVATPLGCRPLELGADLVLHSATKYLNGHSDALAGVLAGSGPLIARAAERALTTGATLAPDAAWLVRRGMRTLHLRWQRCCASAGVIAEALAAHPRVTRVHYPGLAAHPSHAIARRILDGHGGLLSFDVEGGRTAADRVIDRVHLCLRASSLGGVETAISHPASTSHRQLSDRELAAAGFDHSTLRLAVGCEDVDDLLADLESALS
jgi:cystathionine beta-lyase/cystathionine gamma-synthase